MVTYFTKAQAEMRAFKALAPLAGIIVVPGTIQQLGPPAPDITCQVDGIGTYYVELVALDDDSTRTRLSNMYNTEEALRRARESLTPSEQLRVTNELADIHLGMTFDELAGLRERTAALTQVLRAALSKPAGYVGALFDIARMPSGIYRAETSRHHWTTGPHISPFSAGVWCPPKLDLIATKLQEKKYQFVGRLDLFAYAVHDDPEGTVGGREAIEKVIQTNRIGSAFTAVHVFDAGLRRHILSMP